MKKLQYPFKEPIEQFGSVYLEAKQLMVKQLKSHGAGVDDC